MYEYMMSSIALLLVHSLSLFRVQKMFYSHDSPRGHLANKVSPLCIVSLRYKNLESRIYFEGECLLDDLQKGKKNYIYIMNRYTKYCLLL